MGAEEGLQLVIGQVVRVVPIGEVQRDAWSPPGEGSPASAVPLISTSKPDWDEGDEPGKRGSATGIDAWDWTVPDPAGRGGAAGAVTDGSPQEPAGRADTQQGGGR